MAMDKMYTDALKELEQVKQERDRLIEDRARFPDRPDDIGNMISAHIGNLKAAIESADKYTDGYRRQAKGPEGRGYE